MLLKRFFLFKFFSKLVNRAFIRIKFMSRITLKLFFHLGTDGESKQAGSLKVSFVFVIWNTSVGRLVAYMDGMWSAKEQNGLPRAGDTKWLSSLGLFSN